MATKQSANKKVEEPVVDLSKCDKFVRIKNVTQPGENFEAFQPELVWLSGDVIIRREMIGKRDMFEMAFATAADQVDPRNA